MMRRCQSGSLLGYRRVMILMVLKLIRRAVQFKMSTPHQTVYKYGIKTVQIQYYKNLRNNIFVQYLECRL